VRVLHDHDDAAALAILRAVRRALPPDGVLLLAEPMAGTAGAEPVGEAYFGFYLLAMGQGRARGAAEIDAMLREAGFAPGRMLRTRMPLLVRALVTRPAGS
jgi:demethylspheroidene O-methyltransferase